MCDMTYTCQSFETWLTPVNHMRHDWHLSIIRDMTDTCQSYETWLTPVNHMRHDWHLSIMQTTTHTITVGSWPCHSMSLWSSPPPLRTGWHRIAALGRAGDTGLAAGGPQGASCPAGRRMSRAWVAGPPPPSQDTSTCSGLKHQRQVIKSFTEELEWQGTGVARN